MLTRVKHTARSQPQTAAGGSRGEGLGGPRGAGAGPGRAWRTGPGCGAAGAEPSSGARGDTQEAGESPHGIAQPPPGRAWQRPRRAAEPPVPPVPPVPCPLRSCWTTRPPCADTAGPGAAARSWASSACWWAMEPWARPAWWSATPPTATPTSTSPPPSTPSQVRRPEGGRDAGGRGAG